MVRTLTLVLIGVLVFVVGTRLLLRFDLIPPYVNVSGPIVTVHTKRGRALLGRLARPKRLWRGVTNAGIGIAITVMVGSVLMIVISAYMSIANPQPSQLTQPRNFLVIPGVNDFLPLSVAPAILAGFVVTLVVHECGHGILCRVEDIDIESMGVAAFTILPIGAFVEPDERGVHEASRGSRARMYVAGVTNNFVLGLLCFALLFGPVSGAVAVVDGVPVGGALPGSPADRAGVDGGTVITAIDGQPVANESELDRRLRDAGRTVEIGLQNGTSKRVNRSVIVVSAVSDAPVPINRTIVAVNGTAVGTTDEFHRAVENRTVSRLSLDGGENVTAPIGAYADVSAEGPLASAGAPIDRPMYVTRVDGNRTTSASAVFRTLSDAEPGDTVTVQGYSDGERDTYEVTLGERTRFDPGIGVDSLARGSSGFTVDDFGTNAYPADTFLSVVGGEASADSQVGPITFFQRLFFAVSLPFGTAALGFEYNFAGFTGIATAFYTVTGPLAALGERGVFVLANVLFWTGWINLVAGQFNLIPAYPLDGGHLLRAGAESVVSRLPVGNRRRLVTTITVATSLVMFGSFLFIVLSSRFLA